MFIHCVICFQYCETSIKNPTLKEIQKMKKNIRIKLKEDACHTLGCMLPINYNIQILSPFFPCLIDHSNFYSAGEKNIQIDPLRMPGWKSIFFALLK